MKVIKKQLRNRKKAHNIILKMYGNGLYNFFLRFLVYYHKLCLYLSRWPYLSCVKTMTSRLADVTWANLTQETILGGTNAVTTCHLETWRSTRPTLIVLCMKFWHSWTNSHVFHNSYAMTNTHIHVILHEAVKQKPRIRFSNKHEPSLVMASFRLTSSSFADGSGTLLSLMWL